MHGRGGSARDRNWWGCKTAQEHGTRAPSTVLVCVWHPRVLRDAGHAPASATWQRTADLRALGNQKLTGAHLQVGDDAVVHLVFEQQLSRLNVPAPSEAVLADCHNHLVRVCEHRPHHPARHNPLCFSGGSSTLRNQRGYCLGVTWPGGHTTFVNAHKRHPPWEWRAKHDHGRPGAPLRPCKVHLHERRWIGLLRQLCYSHEAQRRRNRGEGVRRVHHHVRVNPAKADGARGLVGVPREQPFPCLDIPQPHCAVLAGADEPLGVACNRVLLCRPLNGSASCQLRLLRCLPLFGVNHMTWDSYVPLRRSVVTWHVATWAGAFGQQADALAHGMRRRRGARVMSRDTTAPVCPMYVPIRSPESA